MKKLTIAQRTELAREQKVCPWCHAEAGRKCRAPSVLYAGMTWPGKPMKSVHAQRLELIPKEVPDD